MQNLLRKIQNTIDTWHLLESGDRVLVAVSGGSDSVALGYALYLLAARYRLAMHWVHINHQLRPDADKDEELVRELAQRWGVSVTMERIHPQPIAMGEGRSLEEVCRELRYGIFQRLLHEIRFDKLAMAHHQQDQAETVLMRIIRGTGLAGLGAMEPLRMWRGMAVIRPLLECTKEELQNWLQEDQITWREDATNKDARYFRNKIRHHLIPLLKKEYNKKIQQRLCTLANCAQVDQQYIRQNAECIFAELATVEEDSIEIPLNRLQVLPMALKRQVTRLAIEQIQGQGYLRRVQFKHWQELVDLYDHRPGRAIVDLPKGIRVQKLGKKVFFYGSRTAETAKTKKVTASSA